MNQNIKDDNLTQEEIDFTYANSILLSDAVYGFSDILFTHWVERKSDSKFEDSVEDQIINNDFDNDPDEFIKSYESALKINKLEYPSKAYISFLKNCKTFKVKGVNAGFALRMVNEKLNHSEIVAVHNGTEYVILGIYLINKALDLGGVYLKCFFKGRLKPVGDHCSSLYMTTGLYVYKTLENAKINEKGEGETLNFMKLRKGKFPYGIKEADGLCSGIFWVITDKNIVSDIKTSDTNTISDIKTSLISDLSEYKFISFKIPCDTNGDPTDPPYYELNSKSGKSYNHKKLWEEHIKNRNICWPQSKKEFDYYPRGRVEISRNKATIYLNPHINTPEIIEKIKSDFGLNCDGIKVNVKADGSEHYKCFLDRG